MRYVLFLCLIPFAIVALGCTTPGLCKRGEPGCACTEASTCNSGATCNSDSICEGGGSCTPGENGCTCDTGDTCDDGDCVSGMCVEPCTPGENGCTCDTGDTCDDGECVGGMCVEPCTPGEAGCGGPLCTHTCQYDGDGACDDGGPNSEFSVCALGTDCTDCGPRVVEELCEFTCQYDGDGACDDGGPNSEFSVCPLGTDCSDCGPRTQSPVDEVECRPILGSVCSSASNVAEACAWACELYCQGLQQFCHDGCVPGFCDPGTGGGYNICALDDGGAEVTMDEAMSFCDGAEAATCTDFGSDTCAPPDCEYFPCEDTCMSDDGTVSFANNGTCDDGGPGADYDACIWGTDCTDCGSRTGPAPECIGIGGCCHYDTKCCGGPEGTTHCLGSGGNAYCRVDCTESQTCETGFRCAAIVDSEGVETGESGCIPL